MVTGGSEGTLYQITVWIDPKGTLKDGVQYSNGSGNLIITGSGDTTEEIRFVIREDQRDLWKFSEFSHDVVMGPADINGQPVIELAGLSDEEIVLKDRLAAFGRYKYTIRITEKTNGQLYTSDPELQNVHEVGPRP